MIKKDFTYSYSGCGNSAVIIYSANDDGDDNDDDDDDNKVLSNTSKRYTAHRPRGAHNKPISYLGKDLRKSFSQKLHPRVSQLLLSQSFISLFTLFFFFFNLLLTKIAEDTIFYPRLVCLAFYFFIFIVISRLPAPVLCKCK